MAAETVTFTAELRDEVSGPAERMAAAVSTANDKVAKSAGRTAGATKKAAGDINVTHERWERGSGRMARATEQAHGRVGRAWDALSGRVRSAGSKVSAAAQSAGEQAGTRMGEGLKSRFAAGVAGLAAAAGLAAVSNAARQAVDTYSQLQDATGAAGVVFGENMSAITEQAANAGETLGMTQAQVIDAANTFGTYGKAAGLSGQELAGFSTEMTALAGDMASFKGTSPEQAIEAIGAALRGESEPIRAYGVMLDDASLKAEAMRQGLISTTKDALTPQQKSLAAHALILQQTTDAQGDFARTADSAANVQKRLQSATTNLVAQVGGLLEPAFTRARLSMLGMVNGMSGFLTRVVEAQRLLGEDALTQDIAAALGFGPTTTAFLTEAIGAVRAFFFTLQAGLTFADGITSDGIAGWAERVAMSINYLRGLSIPWGAVLGVVGLLAASGAIQRFGGILAIAGRMIGPLLPMLGILRTGFMLLLNPVGLIVAGLVLLYTQSEAFRNAVNGLLPVLLALGGQVLQVGAQLAAQLLPVLSQLVTMLLPPLLGLFAQVVPILGQVAAAVLGVAAQVLTALLPPLLTLVSTLLPPLLGLFVQLAPILVQLVLAVVPLALAFVQVLAALTPILPPAAELIALLLNLALQVITPLLGILTTLATSLTQGVGGALSGVMPHVTTFLEGFQGIASWFSGTLGPAIDNVKGWFSSLGDVVGGAINTVKGFADNPVVGGILKGLGIPGFAGGGVVGPSLPGFAGGGVLGGYAPGRDTVPAMLSRGESVLTPELTRALGPANIKAANWAASRRPGGSGTVSAGPTADPRALLGGGTTNVEVNVVYSGKAAHPGEIKAVVREALDEAERERRRRAYAGGGA